jgi:hypothetical protein
LVLAPSAPSEDLQLTSAPNALHSRLQICIVFQLERRKSSVKRTAEKLLSSLATGEESVTSTLVPLTFTAILSRLSSQVATFALPLFQGRVVEYLSNRTAEDLEAREPMDMTSDLLGPVVKQQALLPPAGQQLQLLPPTDSEMATTPCLDAIAADQCDQRVIEMERPAPVELLTDLLSWSGRLTKFIAAERAEAILEMVRSQTEELAIARSELNYLKWQESLKEEVRA